MDLHHRIGLGEGIYDSVATSKLSPVADLIHNSPPHFHPTGLHTISPPAILPALGGSLLISWTMQNGPDLPSGAPAAQDS